MRTHKTHTYIYIYIPSPHTPTHMPYTHIHSCQTHTYIQYTHAYIYTHNTQTKFNVLSLLVISYLECNKRLFINLHLSNVDDKT